MTIEAGYLGPEGSTFGYQAAKKYFGALDVRLRDYDTHDAVIDAVARDEVRYGVVAIENAIDGMLPEIVHPLEESHGKYNISICGEVIVPVELYLLGHPGLTHLARIYSHPSPIRQSRRFLEEQKKKGVKVLPSESTGQAAKKASQEVDSGVIGSEVVMAKYGLEKIIPQPVADRKNNQTRFWILSKQLGKRTGNDKTCLLLNLSRDEAGTLYHALGYFVKVDPPCKLRSIYANPIPGRVWEYTFLIEFSGHIEDPNVQEAYDGLQQSGLIVGSPKTLGSFPCAVPLTP